MAANGRKTIIGVMGPAGAHASQIDIDKAFTLGKLIAQEGWILLSGGRKLHGVMDSASKGAKSAGGLTVGIIPTNNNDDTSDAVDIVIMTDMGSARNNINVLSSSVIIACGMGPGTASEIALALKAKKPVILLTEDKLAIRFFQNLGKDLLDVATSPQEAIAMTKKIIASLYE